MLPEDERIFRTILGAEELPTHVELEYDRWLKMAHYAGKLGPLGIIGCIAVIRHCGLELNRDETPAAIDWNRVRLNVPVLAPVGEKMRRGQFVGRGMSGTAEVLVEGEDSVREIPFSQLQPVPDDPGPVKKIEKWWRPRKLPNAEPIDWADVPALAEVLVKGKDEEHVGKFVREDSGLLLVYVNGGDYLVHPSLCKVGINVE